MAFTAAGNKSNLQACIFQKSPLSFKNSSTSSALLSPEFRYFKKSALEYLILEDYDREKNVERLPGERPFDYHQREKAVKIKYYKLINEKMK